MARNTTPRTGYHVLAGVDHWEVRDDRHDRTLGTFENQDEAIAVARDAVESDPSAQLVVHNPDGSIASQWPTDEDLAFAAQEVIDDGDLAADPAEGEEDDPEAMDEDGRWRWVDGDSEAHGALE
jgi:hypothetical protein